MPALFAISQRGRQLAGLKGSCDNYYLLPTGEPLGLRAWPAWCGACRRFTEAEHFETTERCDEQIKTADYYWSRPGLIPPEDFKMAHLVGNLPELKRRRAWRATRRSPPKCIECGSVAVTILWPEREGDSIDVPGVGPVELSIHGLCSSEGGCVHFWYFTPEGDRIPNPPRHVRC